MHRFSAQLEIIGINPFVKVPKHILEDIFVKAGRSKGPIPVCGQVNDNDYTQTLVRYAGEWRLYINTKMLKNSPKRVGEALDVTVDFDPADRSLPLHPKLLKALSANPKAQQAFNALPPSRQHEINRYISNLKTEAKVAENVQRAVGFLGGNGSFVGRPKL